MLEKPIDGFLYMLLSCAEPEEAPVSQFRTSAEPIYAEIAPVCGKYLRVSIQRRGDIQRLHRKHQGKRTSASEYCANLNDALRMNCRTRMFNVKLYAPFEEKPL